MRRTDGPIATGRNHTSQCLDGRETPPSTSDKEGRSAATRSTVESCQTRSDLTASGEGVAGAPHHTDSREEPQQRVGTTPRTKFTATTRVKMCASGVNFEKRARQKSKAARVDYLNLFWFTRFRRGGGRAHFQRCCGRSSRLCWPCGGKCSDTYVLSMHVRSLL